MKTRDRILEASRELFNAEGVGPLSAVDIASSLGMSAGHLYYHFKGKPQILAELMAAHAAEIEMVLGSLREALAARPDIETLWTHVHILVEEAFDARFFWREPALAQGNEAAAAAARRVLNGLTAGLGDALKALHKAGVIKATAEARDGLAGQMATGVVFHATTLSLRGDAGPPRALVARAAAQVMLPAASYAS